MREAIGRYLRERSPKKDADLKLAAFFEDLSTSEHADRRLFKKSNRAAAYEKLRRFWTAVPQTYDPLLLSSLFSFLVAEAVLDLTKVDDQLRMESQFLAVHTFAGDDSPSTRMRIRALAGVYATVAEGAFAREDISLIFQVKPGHSYFVVEERFRRTLLGHDIYGQNPRNEVRERTRTGYGMVARGGLTLQIYLRLLDEFVLYYEAMLTRQTSDEILFSRHQKGAERRTPGSELGPVNKVLHIFRRKGAPVDPEAQIAYSARA